MTETAPDTRSTTPWHLWGVGIASVFFYGVGAYDHTMALSENSAYFRAQNYDSEQIQYFTDYPLLPAVFWTVGVWSALLAAILLLLRNRWAVSASIAGLLGLLILDVLTFGFRDRWQTLGPQLALFDLGVLALTTGFAVYCRAMKSRGSLR
ncbi:hypothetical protein [Nocardia shimofusensis]|uniref:hypothetical protein n=1 Tax=Nocardia shimofusensis TaxID=228596 RepID=UPI001FDEF2C6|nr:hypothetical protein [Nocardia shimofusensis]